MELLGLVKTGTPLLILGMMLFLERINSKVNTIQEDVRHIKKGITWGDTCRKIHEKVDDRLAKLERKTGLNGSA